MKIAIVGTGNIAFQMGQRLSSQGINVSLIIGRNVQDGNRLASKIGCQFSDNFDTSDPECDVYILAVSDRAIEKVAKSLNRTDAILIHTSGSINMDVLPGNNTGVLWPLYSITKERILNWKEIPLVTESSNKRVENCLVTLTEALGGEQYFLNSKQRAHAHLLAVCANNFTNHFFHLIEEHQSELDLNKKMFHSIVKDTFDTILTSDTEENILLNRQTGPAIRKDKVSMKNHNEMLSENPQLRKLYETFSTSILETYYGEEL